MSENISNELPVITSIDDLTETAIEELTNGDEIVVEEKIVTTKAASKTKVAKASELVEEVTEVAEEAVEEVTEAADEAVEIERKEAIKRNDETEAKLVAEYGTVICKPDLAPFQEAVKPVYESYNDQEALNSILELLGRK